VAARPGNIDFGGTAVLDETAPGTRCSHGARGSHNSGRQPRIGSDNAASLYTPMDGPRELIDVSHVVEDGMITYKGLPAPIVCDWLSREESRQRYAPGTEFHIGKIEMVANTG